MKRLVLRFAFGAIVMLVLDYIWLSKLMDNFYLNQLEPILILEDGRISPRMSGAVAVYLTMLIGILYFGFRKSESTSIHPILNTALLGLFCFAVYDLTNYATLKDWSASIIVADILWGGILFGTTRWAMGLADRIFYSADK